MILSLSLVKLGGGYNFFQFLARFSIGNWAKHVFSALAK